MEVTAFHVHPANRVYSSLWPYSSPRGVRPLAGILLCGARTFLSRFRGSGCLTGFPACDYKVFAEPKHCQELALSLGNDAVAGRLLIERCPLFWQPFLGCGFNSQGDRFDDAQRPHTGEDRQRHSAPTRGGGMSGLSAGVTRPARRMCNPSDLAGADGAGQRTATPARTMVRVMSVDGGGACAMNCTLSSEIPEWLSETRGNIGGSLKYEAPP